MSYIQTKVQSQEEASRDSIIVRTSILGIAANLFLAAFKAAAGLLSGSIAVVLDAVNNLSDAASSVITIVGTKLAARQPDKKHPFGYGRIEYLSAMIISVIVLYAGITSLTESVKAILHPEAPDYSPLTLVIIAVGVVVKILLGRHVKAVGQRVNSDSLVASGEDARLDAVISASTLAAAVIYLLFSVSLEAWLGAVISLVIIRSGVGMLRDTLSQILGERAEASLAREIRQTVCSFPEVQGAYDLILNNYGPDSFNGSIHIEVADTMTADRLDALIRSITGEVYARHNIILTAIGIYAVNTQDKEAAALQREVYRITLANPHVREIHGFYYDRDERTMRMDIVVSLDAPDRPAVVAEVCKALSAAYPDITPHLTLDTDFAEE